MRLLGVLLVLASAAAAAAPAATPYVQAVEFPYYLYPPQLWDRELVWLKTIGVDTIEFSIPWNWHQVAPDEFDFSGRTSPRRNLTGFIKTLRRLGLRGWVRPMPPVGGWLNNGWPGGTAETRAGQRAWLKQLDDLLEPQTEKHGGPIAFVEGRELTIEAPPPPIPVNTLSATDPSALLRSREVLASGRGALLWVNVESAVYPEAWQPAGAAPFRPGAVDLDGQERTSTSGLRRDAALLHYWSRFLEALQPVSVPKSPAHKLPEGVRVNELVSPPVSAVSVLNRGKTPVRDDLVVRDPVTRRAMVVPGVSVHAGDSLWLPLNVSLGPDGPCRECSNFSSAEHIVYATAELLTIEYENGILAMEFAAPEPAEVILQLAREPVGPYIAGGKPTKLDWDERTLCAHLNIPAGKTAGNRVRVGLAIEEPETSAFFNDAKRLTIGQKNVVSTVFSSADVAGRSRLRVPEGFNFIAANKSPNEIDYTIDVPTDALHGDFAPLTLEADGVPLGRARVQLFRPASIRLTEALSLHFGPQSRLPADPLTAPVESRAGTNLEIVIRNNSPQIQTYQLQASGEGLEFLPAKTEISIAALAERPVSLRVFGVDGATGLRDWRLHVTGGTNTDLSMRAVLLPRAGTIAWTADLDGDGSPEWVLESPKARAVFSARDGRWMDFTWKDTDTNFLPVAGAFAQTTPVEVHASGDSLEFSGSGWTRTVRLMDATLTVQQTTALPADSFDSQTTGNLSFHVERRSPNEAVYSIRQKAE